MTILNSNLVFGKDSYVVHFLTQCALAGKAPKAIGGSTGYTYKPVSSDDLATAVQTALTKSDEAKGKRFTVNGNQNATLSDILHLVERSVGK